PSDVFAVVLRTKDEEGRPHIERRLSGPSLSPSKGILTLDVNERERLESGEFYLEVMTRNHPFGAVRAQLLPIRR
ncbi:MAG: CHRD domain-containing protein, partial [Gemmatimonadetes bacterium]|nr:CHRD domain-containing protein [Gemmatimonadota bacterium]